jgi:hypothetical protein
MNTKEDTLYTILLHDTEKLNSQELCFYNDADLDFIKDLTDKLNFFFSMSDESRRFVAEFITYTDSEVTNAE